MDRRLRGAEITAVWYDEIADINGPLIERALKIIKEEESRMKQIDFAKPLRGAGSYRPMTVVKEGLTLVKTNDGRKANQYYVVDEYGKQYGYADAAPSEFRAVENVPEEPKDHLCIWLDDPITGRASIDRRGGSQLQTKATWEKHFGSRIGRDIILVKVPV